MLKTQTVLPVHSQRLAKKLIGTACRKVNDVSFVVGAIACLVIFSHREIVAYSSDPNVAVQMSLGYLDGKSPPTYSPGMAFFISLSRYVGLPLRISNTLLVYIVSYYVSKVVLACFGFKRACKFCCAIFAVVVSLDPTIVYHADLTANSLFSGLMNLVLVAVFVDFCCAERPASRSGFFAGAVLVAALAAVSRPDWQIVELSILLTLPVLIWQFLKGGISARVIGLSVSIIATMNIANFTLTVFNTRVYGVEGAASYLDRRYSEFFATVAALPSAEPTDRYYLADAPRRNLAYRLSPTLNAVRGLMEDRLGKGAIGFDASKKFFGIDDIANAFYFWHIDNTFQMTPREYFSLLERATQEIRARADQEHINLSYPYGGVLSRKTRLWVPHLPSSFSRVYSTSFEAKSYSNIDNRAETPENINSYDIATLRRKSLISSPEGNHENHEVIDAVYGKALHLMSMVLPFCIIYLIFGSVTTPFRGASILVVVLVSLFFVRVAFYTLLDAGFYTASPWYMLPNHLIAYPLLLCAIAEFSRTFGRRRVWTTRAQVGGVHA